MKTIIYDRTEWQGGWVHFVINVDGTLGSTDFCFLTNADGDRVPKQSEGFPSGWAPNQTISAYAQKRTLDLVGGTVATRQGTQFVAT